LEELEILELGYAKKATLAQGAMSLLNQINESNLKAGIFTRNCRSVTDCAINRFKLPVDLSLSREDAPPKPKPDGLLIFLKVWEFNPEELLFIGDFHFDIECGLNAGVKTGLFTNGITRDTNHGAHYIFSSFYDISKFLLGTGNYK